MEVCQILRSREDVEFRAIAMRFLISCSVDPVLWMSTPKYVKDSTTLTLSPATGTQEPSEKEKSVV